MEPKNWGSISRVKKLSWFQKNQIDHRKIIDRKISLDIYKNSFIFNTMKTYTVDVYDNGGEEWFLNGNRHREDGPAIEYADGSKRWYLNGKMHREDGPAIERAAGYKAWYLNGEQLSEAEFNARTKPTASCEGKVVEVDGVKYKLVKA